MTPDPTPEQIVSDAMVDAKIEELEKLIKMLQFWVKDGRTTISLRIWKVVLAVTFPVVGRTAY